MIELEVPVGAADHTEYFANALSTGESIHVRRGEYHVRSGALPVFAPGQLLTGDGQWQTVLHAHGPGDALRICDQSVGAQQYSNCGGVKSLSLLGDGPYPHGGGIVVVGGGGAIVENVVLGGFDENLVLDGTLSAKVSGLFLWHPNPAGVASRGIWMTEGEEGHRGWTFPGSTNVNWLNRIVCNLPTVQAIGYAGTGNVVREFQVVGGHLRMRGNNNRLEDGLFSDGNPGDRILFDSPGTVTAISCPIRNVQGDGSNLVRVTAGTVVQGLILEDVISSGEHMVEFADAFAVAGWARLSGVHRGTGSPVNIDQQACEMAISQVWWPYGDRSIGIGTLKPRVARLDVRRDGNTAKTIRVRVDDILEEEIP